MKNSKLLLLGLCVLPLLTACSSTSKSAGKPVPEMTFAHVEPIYVNVNAVDIENLYNPDKSENDVSSTFPTPPDIALRRYAEKRIKPSGQSQDRLKFVIEEVQINHSYIEPSGSFSQLLKRGGKDHYDVEMRLGLYKFSPDGTMLDQSVFSLEKDITIPEGLSLAEREMEQLKFLEQLMNDVDQAVTSALRDKISAAEFYNNMPVAYLATPELGR
jgi:hypothetical protein